VWSREEAKILNICSTSLKRIQERYRTMEEEEEEERKRVLRSRARSLVD